MSDQPSFVGHSTSVVDEPRWYSRVLAVGTYKSNRDGLEQRMCVTTEELIDEVNDQVRRTLEALDTQGWSAEFDDARLEISVTFHPEETGPDPLRVALHRIADHVDSLGEARDEAARALGQEDPPA